MSGGSEMLICTEILVQWMAELLEDEGTMQVGAVAVPCGAKR